MRWSEAFIPTLRQAPAEARLASDRLLLRAGMIRPAGAGAVHFLPMGLRVLERIAGLLRERLRNLRAQEMSPSAEAGDDGLLRVIGDELRSYKQLPLRFSWTELRRNESARPRGGLLGLAQVPAVGGCFIDLDGSSLAAVEVACAEAMACCGIPFIAVDGADARVIAMLHEAGDERCVGVDDGPPLDMIESAATGPRAWSLDPADDRPLQLEHTPGAHDIEAVSRVMQVAPSQVLKTLVHSIEGHPSAEWLIAVVRGDHAASPWKLAQAAARLGVVRVRLADDPGLLREWPIGFVGPHAAAGRPDALLIVDPDAAHPAIHIAGANRIDHHVRHFQWRRDVGGLIDDPTRFLVADIREAVDADPAPGGGRLRIQPCIELARIQRVAGHGLTCQDASGRQAPVHVTMLSIDLARTIAASVEAHHDEQGILWPAAIAPFPAVICPVRYEGAAKEAADRLYSQLAEAGVDCILDDRDARAGAKFADADLVGFPMRITLGDRTLAQGSAEVRRRGEAQGQLVPLGDVVRVVKGMVC